MKSLAQATLVRAIVEVTADLPNDELEGVEGLRVLVERLADRWLPTSDPLAKARLRGAVAMRELLGNDDGGLTVGEVAKILDVSRQAVDKRRKVGRLLGLEAPKRGVLYPAWQFSERGSTLVGLGEVLAELRAHDEHDAWAQARFFVTENDRLAGARPLDLLRQASVEPVLQAARLFGIHGAA